MLSVCYLRLVASSLIVLAEEDYMENGLSPNSGYIKSGFHSMMAENGEEGHREKRAASFHEYDDEYEDEKKVLDEDDEDESEM